MPHILCNRLFEARIAAALGRGPPVVFACFFASVIANLIIVRIATASFALSGSSAERTRLEKVVNVVPQDTRCHRIVKSFRRGCRYHF